MKLERNVTHGAHVDADVFAGGAIATGRTADQRAILVQQADRQAVEFRFTAVLHLRAVAEQIAHRQVQAFSDTAVEFAHVVFFEGVAQAEHGDFVTHLGERRQRCAPDPLSRRIRRYQLRVLGFQRLEFVEQAVVLDVRDARLVEDVVAVVVLLQCCAQFQDSGFDGGHTCSLEKQKSSRSCSMLIRHRRKVIPTLSRESVRLQVKRRVFSGAGSMHGVRIRRCAGGNAQWSARS